MTGTEKQIKWAEDIKAKTLKALNLNKRGDSQDAAPSYDAVAAKLEGMTEAKWWIEHRNYPMSMPEVIEKMLRQDEFAAKMEAMGL